MSFLPIIIAIFFLMKNNSSFSEILGNIDIDGIKNTLKELGIENTFLNNISSDTISSILSGDIKSLLPLLPSIISMFNRSSYSNSENQNTNYYKNEDLNPIKDIASEQIISTLGNYFK